MPLETTALSPLLAGALGALTVGLTGSVHCLLMCGPLACAGLPAVPGPERRRAVLAYQGARVAAYALVGGALGALGGGVTRSLALDPHGKALSSAVLDLDIPDDEQVFGRRSPDATDSTRRITWRN